MPTRNMVNVEILIDRSVPQISAMQDLMHGLRSGQSRFFFCKVTVSRFQGKKTINQLVAVAGHRSQINCPFGESDVTGMTKGDYFSKS